MSLYLKIPESFMRLILQKGFWFVNIPFDSTVKFQFLAQFPMNHLSHPIVSSLAFFLRKFASLLLFTSLEFFTSALTDGPSLEFEWQYVF